MGFEGFGHAAVFVEDLEAAERVYVELFDMRVGHREGLIDGERRRLPDAGVPTDGPLDHLNVKVTPAERDRIVAEAPEYGCKLDVRPYEGNYRYVKTPDNLVWELEAEE